MLADTSKGSIVEGFSRNKQQSMKMIIKSETWNKKNITIFPMTTTIIVVIVCY
jgi:hypothetical protein